MRKRTLPAIPCLIVIGLLILTVVALLLIPVQNGRRYTLRVVPMELPEIDSTTIGHYTYFSPEELGEDNTYVVTYYNIEEVNITVAGRTMPLEDALRQGLVSVDALMAQAREDSRGEDPLCREIQRTAYGVTTFVYRYSNYELFLTRDGHKNSDGEIHLLESFAVTDLYCPKETFANLAT